MGFRFQKRVRLAPGISMNLGKTGCSFSFGSRGAKVTMGKNGVRKTIGLPGTGLSYSSYDRYDKGVSSTRDTRKLSVKQQNTLDVGFFSGLFLSGDEKLFIEGIKFLLKNDISNAIINLSRIPDVADAGFILAVLYLNSKQYQQCRNVLDCVSQHSCDLGVYFRKYNLVLNLTFPITDLFLVNLDPCPLSLDLLRVEAYQHTKDVASACNLLLGLYKKDNSNLLVKISLAELVLSSSPDNVQWLKTLVTMTDNIENDSPIHTVLLYYRGIVLKHLKLYDSAQKLLSGISRKKKDRDISLMRAILEERAEMYKLQGKMDDSKKMLEKIQIDYPPIN